MRRHHLAGRSAAAGAAIAVLLGAAACGSSGSSGSSGGTAPAAADGQQTSKIAGPGSGAGKTLTVWYMQDDLTPATVKAIGDAFTAATGAQVDVQIQQWDGINTKITTALAQDNPPDVIEIGNTDVPLFAASGGLSDITSSVPELSGGQHWLPGLVGPATLDSKVYGAPLFAGERAVVYNKKIWGAAGVTAPPTSYAELTADLDKIKAANPDPTFSAFYMPGQYWFGGMQFVWDAGGQIATESGGQWTGALESAAAQQGLQAYKNFQNTYSTAASRDVYNTQPDFNALFAQGKAAAILNTNVNTVLKDNPALKDDIGTFPFPSQTAGKSQPVGAGAPRRRRFRALPYWLLAPAAAILAVVVGYPLVRLGIISTQGYGIRSLITGHTRSVGFANYTAVWHDPMLAAVLVRTFVFDATLVAGTLLLGMGAALMMDAVGRRMRTALTVSLIGAWAVPTVASTLVWQWLFQPTYGVVNWLVSAVGVFGDQRQSDWLARPMSAFVVVWLLVVWVSVPFVALTFYAGLSQIPRDHYEAAEIDGAGYWRRFRSITIPYLGPMILLTAVLSAIWDFNVFNQIWLLTHGGPENATTTIGIWSFTKAFSAQSYGQGAAIAVVSVLLLAAGTGFWVRRLVTAGEEGES